MRFLKRHLTVAIFVRLLADALIVNAGLLIGLVARLVGLALLQSPPNATQDLRASVLELWLLYQRGTLLLTPLSLTIFAVTGFYTRGRFYRSRYKLVLILQAISLVYLLFGFLTYFVPILLPYPRSALLVGWAVTVAFLVGARLWSTLWRQILRHEERLFPDARRNDRIKDVLVIGGAGYIGSVLCRQLLAREYRVRVLDTLLYGEDSIRPLFADPSFQFVRGDSRDIEAVVHAMWGVDAVIHLGEIVGDPATALDQKLTQEINVAATRMVAEAAKGYGAQRLIYASSCSVYGASDGLLNEMSALNPVSIYAQAKIDAERILLSLNDGVFNPVILRLATVYGLSPRPRFDLVINLLTAKAVVDGEITIFGGDQWRPFVHVGDVARAILLVLEAPLLVVKSQVFNVGSDEQNYTIACLGDVIHGLIPGARLVNQARDLDRRNYRVSFAKIRRQLGFVPAATVEQGVREIEQAIRAGRLGYYAQPKYSNYKTLNEANGRLEIRNRHINELYAIPAPLPVVEGPLSQPATAPNA